MYLRKKHINIKNPCKLTWNSLNGCGNSKFCESCSTQVIDLTSKSSTEIIDFVMRSKGKVCGKISQDQVDSVIQSNSSSSKLIGSFLIFLLGFATVLDTNGKPIEPAHYNRNAFIKSSMTNELVELNSAPKQDSVLIAIGTVVDETGFPLPNVTINLKGSTFKTNTNRNGEFRIEIKSRKIASRNTLVFNFLGYSKTEVEIETQKIDLKIVMKPDIYSLGEIIIPWHKRLWWTITSPFRKRKDRR